MSSLDSIFPGGLKLQDLQPPPLLPPEHQLRVAMSDLGMVPPDELVFDGVLHRFSSTGKRKDDSGWYVAYDGQVPAGAFGDWRTGIETTWRADIGRELSHVEQMQHATRMREMKAKRERELAVLRESAAQSAIEQWDAAPLASDEHPYLKRKGVSNPGLRVASDGRLMAPMYVGTDLASLQMISVDGEKRFFKGGKTGGAWWAIGGALDSSCKRVYLAEGVATAASIFEATGKPVAIAYSASNMTSTAQSVRAIVGSVCEVVIVGDFDESGTGEREGKKAAQACGGTFIMPPIIGDANDYAQAGGDLAGLLEPVISETRYKLTPASQMTDLPPTRWQIKKIMPARDVVAIYGAPGAGKSFMALDMAVCIAEGREWMGYRTKQAHVVYVVLEAANGFSGRLKAWQIHHGRSLPDSLQVIAHAPFAFSSAKDISDLVDSVRNAVGDGHSGLVVFVDTLARAMGAFEENDNNDMGRVIAASDAIARALQCTVALVAHPGKDATKGMRGGSALLGGLDTVIQLEKDADGLRTWKIEKQKEGEDGLTGCFKLTVVPIGTDEDGDEITSAIVVGAEMQDSGVNVIEETKKVFEARKFFEDAVIERGRLVNGVPFISMDSWNDWTRELNWASDDSRRQKITRTKRILLENGYISEARGGYEATDHHAWIGSFIGLSA
jgi:phage/plasmid primase-like uncharacterized protein/KaiC/GvpD/RAD55 family RecA-like ATPase